MGMIKGAIEREGLSSSEAETLDASGDNQDNQGRDAGNVDTGVSMGENMRMDSLML